MDKPGQKSPYWYLKNHRGNSCGDRQGALLVAFILPRVCSSDSSRLFMQPLIDRMYSNDQRGMSMRRDGDGENKERADQDCGGVNVIVMETFRRFTVVAAQPEVFSHEI